MYETLISCADLAALRRTPTPTAVVDCRFVLGAPDAGARAWLESHVPGAVYAHLEHDLSGPATTDRGRHPLPPADVIAARCGALGIGDDLQVVVYDDAGGMVAARLWWMLRYIGHRAVAVLDGGWQRWVAAGLPVRAGDERVMARTCTVRLAPTRLVVRDEVEPTSPLLDAREPARFRGEVEPLDPVAGHIPGARNHCWRDNLGADGCFLPPVDLARQLSAALGRTPDLATVHYCGSGVSACHNLLAQAHAGLGDGRLYVGSWSEWCRHADARSSIMR